MLNLILNYVSQIVIGAGLVLAALIVYGVLASDGVKTWIKTTVFVAASGSALAVIGWICWQAFCAGNAAGAAVGGVITLALAVLVIWLACVHHKTGWKKLP